jgi:hypothetical protein
MPTPTAAAGPRRSRHALAWTAAAVLLGAPVGASAAPCATQAQPNATTVSLQDPTLAGTLVMQLGLWIEMLDQRGETRDLHSHDAACERVRFKARGASYVLRGDDDLGALVRVAITDDARMPLAYLTPIPDMLKGMAAPGKPAPISGYALMTLQGEVHTAWRIYDAIPHDTVLVKDLSQAVNGRLRPLLRVHGTQVQVFVPTPTQR